MNRKLSALWFSAAVVAASAQAHGAVIDFGSGATENFTRYEEDGFVFTRVSQYVFPGYPGVPESNPNFRTQLFQWIGDDRKLVVDHTSSGIDGYSDYVEMKTIDGSLFNVTSAEVSKCGFCQTFDFGGASLGVPNIFGGSYTHALNFAK